MGPPKVSTEAEEAGRTRAGRFLLLVLTLWALAMIVPGFQRVFESLDSFGLSVDNDGIVTDVLTPFQSPANSPTAAAGIVPGDWIDLRAMRCIPAGTPQCASLVTILGGLGGMQAVLPHTQITLMLRSASDGSPRTVTLQSVPGPMSLAERVVLFADTLAGIAVIITAFWLVWTGPSWMTWGLFLYVIWINPGQSYTYYALLHRWPVAVLVQEVAEALAHGAAFAGLAIFALRFPNDRTEPRWEKAQWVAPLVAATITVLTLLSFFNLFGFPTERITDFSFLIGYVIDAAVLVILLQRRRTLPPQDEQRMRWVIWGCAIGLPAYIFAELCQSADLVNHLWGFSPSQAVTGFLYLVNGLFTYFAAQAVWQRRVVNVSIPLRHGTIVAALSLAVGVPIFQLHEKLALLGEGLHLPTWIWVLVVAPLLLLLLHRLHELAVELMDRFWNRQFHSARRQLEEATGAIVRAESLVEVDRLLLENTVRTLCLSSGAVFRREGGVFRRTHDVKGWNASMKQELHPENDAIALRSLDTGTPVRLGEDRWYALELPAGLETPCLSVPVRSGIPEATAVVLFGPHESGNDIDADEREMLQRLAMRAAAGYERVVTNLLRQEVTQLKAQLTELRSRDRMEHQDS
jgi:hypothetical protein